MSKTLGQKIKALRIQNELTQSEVAKYLGVGDKTISRYENGYCKPSYTVLVALSKYFGIPIQYLINEEESFKQSKVQQLIDELMAAGVITDVDSIDRSVESMLLNAIKIDLTMQLKKKKQD